MAQIGWLKFFPLLAGERQKHICALIVAVETWRKAQGLKQPIISIFCIFPRLHRGHWVTSTLTLDKQHGENNNKTTITRG